MKKESKYVTGFIVPVQKKKLAAYVKAAKLSAKIWMEYGALEYVECEGENVPKGKTTSFPRSIKQKPSELVFLSWISFKSKKHNDQVMEKVMADPRITEMFKDGMPFDGMRMVWGGFKVVVNA